MEGIFVISPRIRKIVGTSARIFIAFVTLFLVFQSVSWMSVLRAFQEANFLLLAAGTVLLIGNLWIRTAKWRYMLRTLDSNANSKDAFWSLLLGISFGAVTPGEVGEFAGRSLHVTGPARAHLVGLAVLDRLHIFLVWIAFGMSSLALEYGKSFLIQWAWAIGAVAGSFIIFMHVDWLRSIAARLNARFVKNDWLERVLDGFGCLTPWQRRITLLYTIGFHLVLCIQMYFFVNAFHQITLVQALVGTSALMFVKAILPFSIGDLGIRELTSVYLFGWFGVPQADAINASLLLFVVNIVLPGVVGILALRRQRKLLKVS
jgi:uncharacterized membrane protein YbhN (UPF0104 family)